MKGAGRFLFGLALGVGLGYCLTLLARPAPGRHATRRPLSDRPRSDQPPPNRKRRPAREREPVS